MAFDLSNYETVESRLARFLEAHPEGRLRTQMLNYTGDACVFYAELFAHRDDKEPVATGWAEEIKTDRGVNAHIICGELRNISHWARLRELRVCHTGKTAIA